jgi:DNA-directed RNA polymerase specialized sigma24 family protein
MIQTIENRLETAIEFDREEFFSNLYLKVFPSVANFIRKQNGTLDDAKDVFHDALIIFYEKKTDRTLEVHLTDEAYVFGIVKHLWIKKVRDDHRVLLTEMESIITLPDDIEIKQQSISIVAFLKSAGQKCMALLQAFYYEKKSLELISSSFGFSSIRSATVQKYKCLEKVRDLVKNKSKNYEDFINQA